MPVDRYTIVRSTPRISEDNFVTVLRDYDSFPTELWLGVAESDKEPMARRIYRQYQAGQLDPLYALSVGWGEHQLGTNSNSVLWRSDTKSMTNARSCQTPGMPHELISDPVRGGPYVRYRHVEDSCIDHTSRITRPDYTYAQQGADTIIEIAKIWTEGDWEAFADTNVNFMNIQLERFGEPGMATADDSRFVWMPDVSEYGYPQGASGRGGQPIDLLIVHITAGTDSSAWLRGNNGSSTHYLTDRSFRPREQHVKESNAAWTAGHQLYNQRGINLEYETPAGVPISDEQHRNAAETARPICERNGIPLSYLGRDNGPGRKGIIGHCDVPDPDGSGWGGAGHHVDPGTYWDWQRFLTYLNEGSEPPPLLLEGNPFGAFGYYHGIRARLDKIGRAVSPNDVQAGVLSWAGWPMENEWRGVDGCTYQRGERCIIQWTPNTSEPWDLVQCLRGFQLPERAE